MEIQINTEKCSKLYLGFALINRRLKEEVKAKNYPSKMIKISKDLPILARPNLMYPFKGHTSYPIYADISLCGQLGSHGTNVFDFDYGQLYERKDLMPIHRLPLKLWRLINGNILFINYDISKVFAVIGHSKLIDLCDKAYPVMSFDCDRSKLEDQIDILADQLTMDCEGYRRLGELGVDEQMIKNIENQKRLLLR